MNSINRDYFESNFVRRCPRCHHIISKDNFICPICGYKINDSLESLESLFDHLEKQVLVFFVVLLLTITVISVLITLKFL
ncbi:MAG: hypothetical protein QW279_04850 [Candidatus Jordarchaeaceae archaeon]